MGLGFPAIRLRKSAFAAARRRSHWRTVKVDNNKSESLYWKSHAEVLMGTSGMASGIWLQWTGSPLDWVVASFPVADIVIWIWNSGEKALARKSTSSRNSKQCTEYE